MAERKTRDVAGILHFLTPQQMAEEIVRLDRNVMANAPATLPESMGRDEMLRYYSEYANMVCGEVVIYQKRIRDLQAVLQQALDALDTCDGDPDSYKGEVQWHDEQKVDAAIKALRAALCGNDAETDAEMKEKSR